MLTYGVETGELEEGTIATEAVVIVKGMEEDGNITWSIRTSEGLTDVEALGMLSAAKLAQEEEVRDSFIADDDDPREEDL